MPHLPCGEDKPLEERDITGTLGMPVKMDAEFLRTTFSNIHQALYSWIFRDLYDQGLQVDLELLQLASMYETDSDITDETRATSSTQYANQITLHIDYQVSSFGYVDPKGYTIITSVSDETIMNTIKEYYTNHFINGVAIWLDQIYDSGFRAFTLNLSCRTLLSTELIKKDVERQLYDIAYHIKRNYFADIVFYFHLTMSSSIFEGGGGGTRSDSGITGTKIPEDGFNSGGYNPLNPESGRPCRNEEKGKANPLVVMDLMPPNRNNIGGARFGYTRVNKYGEKKFHQGIDLMAEPNTPVYALFSGTIIGPYVTEQPNKIGENYPSGYIGDTNGAGNRFGVRSTINGKTITVYYWHLSADQPVAMRNGKPLKVGDYVYGGTVIGYTGVTGNANSEFPHLHLGIMDETGKWINPELYLNATVNGKTGEISTPCDSYQIY